MHTHLKVYQIEKSFFNQKNRNRNEFIFHMTLISNLKKRVMAQNFIKVGGNPYFDFTLYIFYMSLDSSTKCDEETGLK